MELTVNILPLFSETLAAFSPSVGFLCGLQGGLLHWFCAPDAPASADRGHRVPGTVQALRAVAGLHEGWRRGRRETSLCSTFCISTTCYLSKKIIVLPRVVVARREYV